MEIDRGNMTKLPEPQIKEQTNKQDSLSLAHSPNATLKKKINVIQTGIKANPYHTQAHCNWRKVLSLLMFQEKLFCF